MIKKLFVITVLLAIAAFFYSKYVRNVIEVIPFEVIRHSIFFDMEIQGKNYTFQFDTGAGTSVSPKLKEELNLDTIGSHHVIDMYSNISKVNEVELPELKLGPLVSHNMKVGVINPIQSYSVCDIELDGYLGMEYFEGKVIKIDLKNKKLTVANSIGAFGEDFGMPLDMEYHHGKKPPFINIFYPDLNAKELVLFDTGAGNDFLKLSKNTFQQMIEHGELKNEAIIDTTFIHKGRGLFGGQKDTINYIVNFSKVAVGNTIFENVTTQTFDSKANSNLGAAILDKAVVVLDLVMDKFYAKAYLNSNLAYPLIEGFKFYNFEVTEVSQKSSAYKAGVRKGHILKSVNKFHFDSLTICDQLNIDWSEIYQQKNIQFTFESEDGEIVYDYKASAPSTDL